MSDCDCFSLTVGHCSSLSLTVLHCACLCRVGHVTHSFLRSFVRCFVASFGRSVVRSFGRLFLRSFVPSILRSFVVSAFLLRCFIPSVLPSFLRSFILSLLRSNHRMRSPQSLKIWVVLCTAGCISVRPHVCLTVLMLVGLRSFLFSDRGDQLILFVCL